MWDTHDDAHKRMEADMAESTAHAESVIEAFNNGDWNGLTGLLGDATYNELGTQRSIAGAAATIEAMQGWKAAMPDVTGTKRRFSTTLPVCACTARP